MFTALITGASEGIGRAFVQALVDQGYGVTGVARNEARLKELKETLGERFTYVVADLSESAGMDQVAELLRTRSWDLLINNAGFGLIGEFADLSLERQRALVRLNCEALMVLSHAFLQAASPGVALINVSSMVSFVPMPAYTLYAASKAFVTSFSEGLAYLARKRGVYVMVLCPGTTATSFHKRAGGQEAHIRSPLAASPEDVVRTALRALTRRQETVVIGGALNHLAAWLPRLFPRSWVVKLTGRLRL